MIHLALRTEYSFKKCYGFLDDLPKIASDSLAIGIADNNNTFGHVKHHKNCRKNGIKPILGVRLMVCDRPIEKKKTFGPIYIFIAKNVEGLTEIYKLVRLAYSQFYYHPRLFQSDLVKVSPNVFVIANNFNISNRIDFIALDQTTPKILANLTGIPRVAICLNWYTNIDDKIVYQLHAGERGMESQTYPQHILSDEEWLYMWPNRINELSLTHDIAALCENYDLPRAPMVKYKGKITLRQLCEAGARTRGIDLKNGAYKDRFEREMKLILERKYADYFLIVAQMIKSAKNKMLVGPSRGSSAGSLVCYLASITEVDPLKFDLLFERFIDINRADLPDIDIDFPDLKRKVVIKTLVSLYGEEHVSRISTISKMNPKSAIGEFAMGLCIPAYETDAVKNSIIERSTADARAMMRIEDTFESTEVGMDFIKKYPEMMVVKQIEGHARHAGVHAAGVIVCNEPLTNYGGINVRNSALMMDYKDADSINLLKIDCLGLRTLSILESVADQINMPYKKYYKLPLDDEKVFDIFNSLRLIGIFQFQGNALQYVTRQMGVHNFDDICAIGALGRPGPIHSGGTNIFISRRTGAEPVEYLSNHPSVVKHTKETYGVIIYQEQLMMIAREYGGLSWEDVSEIRRSASKSLGEEYFGKFKDKFVTGAVKNGANEDEASKVWDNMVTFGSWGFNKSHAYGYGLISYWTAWAKTYHPLEFAVANLNNAKSDEQAVKLLRDMVRHDGLEYTAFDADLSVEEWSVQDGKLLGGLKSLHGIGPKKAKNILEARAGKRDYTSAMIRTMMDPETQFNILFPCEHWWGDFFTKPQEFGLTKPPAAIETILEPGEYLLVGKMMDRNLRDLNETQSLARRGGQYITDHKFFLNLILEDDTDTIVVTVNRYRYEELGREIAESGKVGHDWYLVKGVIKDKWRRIDVTQIMNLNNWGKENHMGPDS
jgi:DNA polymerase III alpha subunit